MIQELSVAFTMNRRVLFTFLSATIIFLGTLLAIKFAQGYRPGRDGLRETGLLSANSYPTGASVYINGNLTTATDDTLNLTPGEYDIEIRKDGYTAWKKRLKIEKELVTQTNALLLPVAPSLTPLTYTGAQHLTPSTDGQSILFTTASASASKANGIYILDLSDSPLALQKGARQIASYPDEFDTNKLTFLWSPDSSQILMSDGRHNVMLNAGRTNDLESLRDITVNVEQVLSEWDTEVTQKRISALEKFPPEIVKLATNSATHVYLSPDQERIVYTATESATIPETLIPPVQAANSQPQERTLTAGRIYTYDRHEDRNFAIAEATYIVASSPTPSPTPRPRRGQTTQEFEEAVPTSQERVLTRIQSMKESLSGLYTGAPQWLPDSRHLILMNGEGIEIVEYDGTNKTLVYAGPFAHQFLYPWPNGSKLLILTNFHQPASDVLNLYALGLR